MVTQASLIWKPFLTLITWIQVFFSVSPCSLTQNLLLCKPFVTHCIQIRPWLVIMWMLSDIITIIFSLNSKWSFTCTICTALSNTFTDSNILYNVHKYLSPSTVLLLYLRLIQKGEESVWRGLLPRKKREILLSKLHISVTIRVSIPRIQISLQQNVMNVDTVSQQSVSLDDIHSVVYHCCHTQTVNSRLLVTSMSNNNRVWSGPRSFPCPFSWYLQGLKHYYPPQSCMIMWSFCLFSLFVYEQCNSTVVNTAWCHHALQ